MSYVLSPAEEKKLLTCHDFIVKSVRLVLKYKDIVVIEGSRSVETQDAYFAKKVTKIKGNDPRAKHVVGAHRDLSDAIDLAPQYPTNPVLRFPDHRIASILDPRNSDGIKRSNLISMCKEWSEFTMLAGLMLKCAEEVAASNKEYDGWRLRWGGDWNQNYLLSDNEFNDLPHFEIWRK